MNSSTDESNKLDIAACVTSKVDDLVDLREFLDFLILAYRINDVLTSDKDKSVNDTRNINWTELSRNNLFLRLLDKKYDPEDEVATENMITHSTNIERVQRILKHKLKDIMSEGILDSVLPFIVKKTLTANNVSKTFESFGSKINNNPSSKEKTRLKQKCIPSDNSSRSKGE